MRRSRWLVVAAFLVAISRALGLTVGLAFVFAAVWLEDMDYFAWSFLPFCVWLLSGIIWFDYFDVTATCGAIYGRFRLDQDQQPGAPCVRRHGHRGDHRREGP